MSCYTHIHTNFRFTEQFPHKHFPVCPMKFIRSHPFTFGHIRPGLQSYEALVKTLANLPAKTQAIAKISVLNANEKREKSNARMAVTKPFYFTCKRNTNKMCRTVKMYLYFEILTKSLSEYKYKLLKFLPWQ